MPHIYIRTDFHVWPLVTSAFEVKVLNLLCPLNIYAAKKSPVRCGVITGYNDDVLSIRPLRTGSKSMQNANLKCIFFHIMYLVFRLQNGAHFVQASISRRRRNGKNYRHWKQIETNTSKNHSSCYHRFLWCYSTVFRIHLCPVIWYSQHIMGFTNSPKEWQPVVSSWRICKRKTGEQFIGKPY